MIHPVFERHIDFSVGQLLNSNSPVEGLIESLLQLDPETTLGKVVDNALQIINQKGLFDTYLGCDFQLEESKIRLYFSESPQEEQLLNLVDSFKDIASEAQVLGLTKEQPEYNEGARWVIILTVEREEQPEGEIGAEVPIEGELEVSPGSESPEEGPLGEYDNE